MDSETTKVPDVNDNTNTATILADDIQQRVPYLRETKTSPPNEAIKKFTAMLRGESLKRETPFIFEVVGSIGVGKSTLLENQNQLIALVKKRYPKVTRENSAFLLQDVSNWYFLDLFYKEPSKYALFIQLEIYYSYLKRLVEFSKNHPEIEYIFTESGVHESLDVYCKNSYNNGFISLNGMRGFQSLIIDYECLFSWDLVWIYSDLESCMRRIQKRGRKGEEALTLETLMQLEVLRREMITYYEHRCHQGKKTVMTLLNDDSNQPSLIVKYNPNPLVDISISTSYSNVFNPYSL